MGIEYMLISQINESCLLHISGMMCQSIFRLQDVHPSLPSAPTMVSRMDIPDTSRNVRIQGFIQIQASSNVYILYVHYMPALSVLFLEHVTAS